MEQVGSNVVANGSGAIDLTGLTFLETAFVSAGTEPRTANIVVATGVPGFFSVDEYGGASGPTGFGSGGFTVSDTSSGDVFGLIRPLIFVPAGYVSGHSLSDSMTFNNATFASLGVTPGVYTWRWGTDGANQLFRLVIGPNTVPDSGSTVSLLGFALLGLAAVRRRLSC